MRVVLATSNPGKIAELAAMLAPLGIEVLPQSRYTATQAVETGLTFVENAILKARHAASHSGLAAIADDSGIEVDALDGAPGIHSARYAGERASDQQNLAKLLRELEGVESARRTARYRCALVYLRSDRDSAPIVCQESWEGRIGLKPRGSGGFGYDPIFELPQLGLTAAELPAAIKNELSHRGKAFRALFAQLAQIVARPSGSSD
ncbi:MAG TPA: RdgB/HAM1 family non-canonical purine NTP pyrophosphatase [Steroidobacteraceae bacterium]|nr:RdgB/HAM1 family non-canonical purine NTP pyrophosphatase [Steroidobacteraceae bacterium]